MYNMPAQLAPIACALDGSADSECACAVQRSMWAPEQQHIQCLDEEVDEDVSRCGVTQPCAPPIATPH